MEINILVHGNSEGFQSDFMQYIYTNLTKIGKKCYGFDFNYLKTGKEPSVGLKEEVDQLIEVVRHFEQLGYTSINIIGKSLGGVICLNENILNNPYIKNIYILGFPIILGFPLELFRLKTKPIAPDPCAIDEYTKLFKDIGKDMKKVKIIQGTKDLSCPVEQLKSLCNMCLEKPDVYFVENASHSFKPITEDTTFEENLECMINIIKGDI